MTNQAVMLSIAALIGAAVAFQALVNSRLQQFTGSILWAAVISFCVGTLGLLLVTSAARSGLPEAASLMRAPWWAWTGGLLGAAYIAVVIVLVPRMSPAWLFGAVIFGQMLLLVTAEHFGWTGIERHAFSPVRLAGILLIVVGAVLCKR